MSKADLKTAMDRLQVKQPLKLPNRVPIFQPPSVIEPPKGQISPQDSTPLQDQKSSEDDFLSSDSLASKLTPEKPKDIPVGFVPLDRDRSQDESPSSEVTPSPGASPPPDSKAPEDVGRSEDCKSSSGPSGTIARARWPRRATAQDGAVTETASARDRLGIGYTRVPNSILMRIVGGEISRAEIKIILLVARMTISFNRPYAPLSKNVIVRMTGVQGRAVLEALQKLEQEGLVRKIAGNAKQPNQLGLNFDETFGITSSLGEKTSEDEESASTRDRKTSPGWDGKSPHKKDSIKNNLKSLSQEVEDESLQAYFEQLKAPRKRESEWQAFRELKSHYELDEISSALHVVQKRAIHSPMAYLAKAMGEVLSEVQNGRRKAEIAATQERAEEERRAQEEELAQREEHLARERESAFFNAFPNEKQRSEMTHRLCRELGLRPESEMGRRVAVGIWWERHGKSASSLS